MSLSIAQQTQTFLKQLNAKLAKLSLVVACRHLRLLLSYQWFWISDYKILNYEWELNIDSCGLVAN